MVTTFTETVITIKQSGGSSITLTNNYKMADARNYTSKSASAYATARGSNSPPPPNDSPSEPGNLPNSKPNAPTGLRAQVLSSSEVRLTWNAPAGGAEGYNIYRDGRYSKTVKGQRNITITGLRSSNTYRFTVVAFRHDKYSTKSSAISVRTAGGANNPSPPPPAPGNGHVPAGYNLVFAEEFNRNSIDTSKWNTRYRWGPDWIINNEQQYYVDINNQPNFGRNPFSFNGGKLTIKATRTPGGLRGKANNQRYISGAMTTHRKFTMTYGYVEMRAKLPKGKGLWPALWLLHNESGGKRPEIDIVEMLGDNTRVVYQTYHYYINGNLRSTPSFRAGGRDYSNAYHTFGMKWERGKITWYVDGQKTNEFSSGNVSNEPMYLLVNLALGGSWAGSPDGSTRFPANYQIDYIRAYQR